MRVDADLWLCALDLATLHGWKPRGIVGDAGGRADDTRLEYFRPAGQRVTDEDARELAQGLETALPRVPDSVLELQDRSFGADHTMKLLRRAVQGRLPRAGDAQAAVEIMSGPPKNEARKLLEFLRGGAFTIHTASS